MKKTLLSVIAVAVIVGGAAFYGGMKYNQRKTPQRGGGGNFANLSPEERQQRIQQFGGSGAGFGNGGSGDRAAGGFASGEILTKDDKSITIKMRDGGSKIVFYSDTTEVGKFVTGAIGDLEVGKNVSLNGAANSDGTMTAQSIQIRQ